VAHNRSNPANPAHENSINETNIIIIEIFLMNIIMIEIGTYNQRIRTNKLINLGFLYALEMYKS